MEQKMKLFLEIASKEDVAAKLTATEDLNEVLAILAANGLELTADELTEISKTIAENIADEELNEEALDDVAGGAIGIKSPDPTVALLKAIKKIKEWFRK